MPKSKLSKGTGRIHQAGVTGVFKTRINERGINRRGLPDESLTQAEEKALLESIVLGPSEIG